jgi:hypothetical protein
MLGVVFGTVDFWGAGRMLGVVFGTVDFGRAGRRHIAAGASDDRCGWCDRPEDQPFVRFAGRRGRNRTCWASEEEAAPLEADVGLE